MKRFLLIALLVATTGILHAQLEEDFSPAPTGWILSSGANFGTVNGNDAVYTPGVGGNNPAVIGTPAVNKTSNTVKVCFDINAYNANLNSQVAFPANTYARILFVNASVTSDKEAQEPGNIYTSQPQALLTGGKNCFTFTFPAEVQASSFKVFISFYSDNVISGTKFVLDNWIISGVDEVCGSGGNCAPTALDDLFNRVDRNELSFNAVLYGSNLSYPAPGATVAVDPGGTDNDQNDAYANLQWSVVTQPVNGFVTINANGTATITRLSTSVTQLIFTYRLCDPANACDQATVTVNWPPAASLPVSLLSYHVSRSGSYVTLQWTTTSESNNAGFEIQRSTGNGIYETAGFIATKAADGYSGTPLQYSFKELNAFSGTSWYRLVQKDKDGTTKVYGAKGIRGTEESARILVYPNPGTSGNMSILFSSSAPHDIAIADLGGKVVKSYNGFMNDNLVIGGLNPGIYMLLVTNKLTNEKQVHKIVIVK